MPALLTILANELRLIVTMSRCCAKRTRGCRILLEQVACEDVVAWPLADLAYLLARLTQRGRQSGRGGRGAVERVLRKVSLRGLLLAARELVLESFDLAFEFVLAIDLYSSVTWMGAESGDIPRTFDSISDSSSPISLFSCYSKSAPCYSDAAQG